jgi:hypothetical protein
LDLEKKMNFFSQTPDLPMKFFVPMILFFQLLPTSLLFCQKINDPIAHSILAFIQTVDPLFESTYVKSEDGADQKYTEFLISGIKSADAEIQRTKSLTSFGMVMASLSKADAKAFGTKISKDEEIRQEYQSFLYLGTIPVSSDQEKTQVYLHAIKSIAFHLKVKEIPAYENLGMVNNYVEKELQKNFESFNEDDADRINQIQLHFLFSIALENFSKFLSVGILEEDQNPAFDELASQRARVMPQVSNIGELSSRLKSLGDKSAFELNQNMEFLLADYLDLTSNLIGKIIKE